MSWNNIEFWNGLETSLGDHKFEVIMFDEGSTSWFMIDNMHMSEKEKIERTKLLVERMVRLINNVLRGNGVVLLEFFMRGGLEINNWSIFLCILNHAIYSHPNFNRIGRLYLNSNTEDFFIYGKVKHIEHSILHNKPDIIKFEDKTKQLIDYHAFCGRTNALLNKQEKIPKVELSLREFVKQRIL
jgi:hypothetical protein